MILYIKIKNITLNMTSSFVPQSIELLTDFLIETCIELITNPNLDIHSEKYNVKSSLLNKVLIQENYDLKKSCRICVEYWKYNLNN
jgi:hypothetical protein